ncbi:mediator complex subunit, partial [Ascosphaera acerosa]
MPDVYFDHHLLDVHHLLATQAAACLAFSDGALVPYDLAAVRPLADTADPLVVTGLADAGLRFPRAERALHWAVSPNGCMALAMDHKRELQIIYPEMDERGPVMAAEEEKSASGFPPTPPRAAVALALTFARTATLNVVADDIVATAVHLFRDKATRLAFTNELYNALPSIRDVNDEKNKEMLSNPYIPRCLSVQAAMDFPSFTRVRALPALLPWLTLNLRHISVIYSYVFRQGKRKDFEYHDHGESTYRRAWLGIYSYSAHLGTAILRIIKGNIAYTLDLMNFIMDELLTLADSLQALKGDAQALKDKVSGSMRTISIQLLLSTMPRNFLKYCAASVIAIATGYQGATGLDILAYRLCSETVKLVEDSPVPPRLFETLIMQAEAQIKQAYPSKEVSIAAERDLLIRNSVHPVLHRTVVHILTVIVPSLARAPAPAPAPSQPDGGAGGIAPPHSQIDRLAQY